MGVMDWINGDDGSESEPVATDGLGFDDDLDDFDDGMDGDFDDGMNGDFDGDEADDGFDDGGMGGLDGEMGGGFDDGGMDDFGGGGLDDSDDGLGGPDIDPDTIAEMEDRISELENQVSSTTSEMSTVREENKQIGETVEELDDTIRKLLDIYEMVTRGINPFVDDAREMGGLESEGAFGLFEMEEESEDDLDPDVAEADAEAFFDEDFGDIDVEDEEAELAAGDELADDERDDPAAALDGEDDLDEDEPAADDPDEDADADADAGGGTSFDELKSEYEDSGGWDEVEGEEGDGADEDDPVSDEFLDEEHEEGDAEADGMADGEPTDGALDPEDAESESEVEVEDSEADEVEDSEASDDGFVEPDPVDPESDAHANGTLGGEPGARRPGEAAADAYLAAIPARYTAESVVLEWTEFLVEVGGAIGAVRALRQYREQGWITRRVERTMAEHVRNAAVGGGTEETRDLRVQDHRESLTYVSRLAGDVDEARLLEELSALGGDSRGIRR